MLKADWWNVMVDNQEATCHPKMDDHPEIVVQQEQQILSSSTNVADTPADD
jgi:hypothetical protein